MSFGGGNAGFGIGSSTSGGGAGGFGAVESPRRSVGSNGQEYIREAQDLEYSNWCRMYKRYEKEHAKKQASNCSVSPCRRSGSQKRNLGLNEAVDELIKCRMSTHILVKHIHTTACSPEDRFSALQRVRMAVESYETADFDDVEHDVDRANVKREVLKLVCEHMAEAFHLMFKSSA